MKQKQAFQMFINEDKQDFRLGSIFWNSLHTIYSYGHHYALCRRVDIKPNQSTYNSIGRVYLLNNSKYSKTTTRQTSLLRECLKENINPLVDQVIELNFQKIEYAYRVGNIPIPEDDYWLIDTFLKPYYSSGSIQLTIDQLHRLVELQDLYDELRTLRTTK